MCVWGERCGGNGPFARKVYVSVGGWKGRAGGGGGKGPPVQGSALGKEGRKYGVGMGKNCPFMRGKRLLYPTNYWEEVPDACAVGVGVENLGCAGIW